MHLCILSKKKKKISSYSVNIYISRQYSNFIFLYSLRSLIIDFLEKKFVSERCIFCVFYEKMVNFKKINWLYWITIG